MKIGYLDCCAGISGDMMLGALVDAGVPFDVLSACATALNIGARLEKHTVMRSGIGATKIDVLTSEAHHHHDEHEHHHHDEEPHTHEHSHGHTHTHEHEHEAVHAHPHDHAAKHTHAAHRGLSEILGIIAAAPLSASVKQKASSAFTALGQAEAAIHNVPLESVHFHEVGAVDTIIDIVCSAAGAEALGIDRWVASPLNVGSGTVRCQHGVLPIPAPATLKLLAGAPIYSAGTPMERVTPTGASILRMLDVHYEAMPVMRVVCDGYGAGGRETPEGPNALRLIVGETKEEEKNEEIAVIHAVIDDASPQLIAYASEALFAAGAWDVYTTPVQMKKGRSGVEMTVLAQPTLLSTLSQIIFRETTTIGLRWQIEHKQVQEREFVALQTEFGNVQMKIARWSNGGISNIAPEFEDCRKLALERNVPLKDVQRAAFAAWNKMQAESEGK